MQDAAQNVIFSNTDPDIVVTFDLSLGLHLVWSLRQTKSDVSNKHSKFRLCQQFDERDIQVVEVDFLEKKKYRNLLALYTTHSRVLSPNECHKQVPTNFIQYFKKKNYHPDTLSKELSSYVKRKSEISKNIELYLHYL